jgi:hypothetical protein
MSQMLHIDNEDRVLCGTRPRGLALAVLSLVLKGDSVWTAYVPPAYKRCERCAKKLAKDYPEVILMELRDAML